MAVGDARLVLAAVAGIALAIVLIVRGGLHPFVALLCGAFVIGPLGGLAVADTAKAVQKGAGDILGGTGLVVALGLALGTMLQLSDGAAGLARVMIGNAELRRAPWMSLLVALVIGLPLFFETGLVLLLPIIASAATGAKSGANPKLGLMLAALSGLSVVHALVPPHPGPLIAIGALGANLGRTIGYGLLVGIPTAILAGPVFAKWGARNAGGCASASPGGGSANVPAGVGALPAGVRALPAGAGVLPAGAGVLPAGAGVLPAGAGVLPAGVGALPSSAVLEHRGVPVWRALVVVLLPVALILAGQVQVLMPSELAPRLAWLSTASNPVLALLLACLVALPLLFGRRMKEPGVQQEIWLETMKPVGAILLAIGAGGALKQVLVSAGVADMLARFATSAALSPILLGWSIAVAIRLATGSATVATITAAGIMPSVISGSGVAPEWTVLAIGAGSVFFSHVNDPGFWLVKSYLGTDTPTTFRTWSVLETIISVVGLAFVFALSHWI